MDPLSIAVASAGLASHAFKISAVIYSFTKDVQGVDTNLVQLRNEVKALQSGLEGTASTFESTEVVEFFEDKERLSHRYQSTRLLKGLMPLLADCQHSLEKLEAIIAAIEGKPGRPSNVLFNSLKAVKLNLRSKDVTLIRHEIRGYTGTMQMTIQMVLVCLAINTNKKIDQPDVIAQSESGRMEQGLSSLDQQITTVQQSVAAANKDQAQREETVAIDASESRNQLRRIEGHLSLARTIYSSASVYAGSTTGTIMGDDTNLTELGSTVGMDEERRQRIKEWLPSTEVSEEDREGDDLADDIYHAKLKRFKARLQSARDALQLRDYEAASKLFNTCLKESDFLKTLPPSEVNDIHLEMGMACRGLGLLDEELHQLQPLLEKDISPIQQLYVQIKIAEAYFLHSELTHAENHAAEALKTGRKLLGRTHATYLRALSLMVLILKGLGKDNDAEIYASLIPSSSQDSQDHFSKSLAEEAQALRWIANNTDLDTKKLDSSNYLYNYRHALRLLSFHSNKAALRILLLRVSDTSTTAHHSSSPLLSIAALHGLEDIVHLLLQRGADVNALSQSGNGSALECAAVMRHIGTARLLLDHGADLGNVDMRNVSPEIRMVLEEAGNGTQLKGIKTAIEEVKEDRSTGATKTAIEEVKEDRNTGATKAVQPKRTGWLKKFRR